VKNLPWRAVSASACFRSLKENKITLRAIVLMVFVSNPFRPAKADPYLSRKYGQQPKEVTKKDRSLLKFLTAKNDFFLGFNWIL
jgi:hypothetical protein